MSDEHHIVPWKNYAINFAVITFLMGLTVWAAYQEFGAMNLPIAIVIAIMKTICIALFFMNVRYSSQLTWVFAGAGFFWFVIMIGFIIVDFTEVGSMYTSGLPGSEDLIGVPSPGEVAAH